MKPESSLLLLCLLAAGLAHGADKAVALPVPPTMPPELTLPMLPASAPAAVAVVTAPVVPVIAADTTADAPACPVDQDCTVTPPPLKHAGKGKAKAADTANKLTLVSSPILVGAPARRALQESHGWAENPRAMPALSDTGSVVFNFGESAPTIICAPLRVCDLALEPGETIEGTPHLGDAVRWKISPAMSGEGNHRVTHIIIKATDVDLDTNMILPTDRRTYHLRLVSSRSQYMAQVSFTYPERADAAWSMASTKPAANGLNDSTADMPAVAADRLYFDYQIEAVKGKPGFKPVRAMDDGYHTFLVMPDGLQLAQAPVLVAIDPAGNEQMVNYRLKGNMFVVDGTINKLALLTGTGHDQQRVEITRKEPCQRHGWLGMCWDKKEPDNG